MQLIVLLVNPAAIVHKIERFGHRLLLPADLMVVDEQALRVQHGQIIPRQNVHRLRCICIRSQATRRYFDRVAVQKVY